MSGPPPFEEIEHDADVALRVRGKTLERLFVNACGGMIELMLDPRRVKPAYFHEVDVQGDDLEGTLVKWLQEILYVFEVDGFAPCRAEVQSVKSGRVIGRLWGEEFTEGVHELRNLIKAVTWHNLKVEQTDDGYEVTIVFDV